jgi:hypothetical protein
MFTFNNAENPNLTMEEREKLLKLKFEEKRLDDIKD